MGISSLIDTWLQVRDIEVGAERTRGLYLIKSRGMGHSNQVREFLITSGGIDLVPVAVGPDGVLTGSARLHLEAQQRAQALTREHEAARRQRHIEHKRQLLEAQIAAMRSELAAWAWASLALAALFKPEVACSTSACPRWMATRSRAGCAIAARRISRCS
jgi:circadian clock protein KaiC